VLTPVFDIAIVGSGIGGTLLASILARQGVQVLLIEAASHPRFAIGESSIPETTFGMRVLARRYGVPEIENLATHGAVRRHVSPACGVKRNFGFVHHRDGEPMRARACTQYPTWGPPLGPDSHYFRQDVDAYLLHTALSYGATVHTQTKIKDVRFDDGGATLTTEDKGAFRVSYIVDAGGPRALLPEQLRLREEPPYRTRSRSIYTHMVDVRPFDEIAPSHREHGMPSPFSQGTLHHMFEGGWMWVIPFDNHVSSPNPLCSVGINLDVDRYPQRPDETAEQEFWRVIRRFPSVARQFERARAARPFIATQRMQFSSRQVVGHRFCLMPHASDFIDPLFSSGLAVTVFAVNALAHRLIDAVREQDFSTQRFEFVGDWTKRMFRYYDDLVSCSYIAFDDFDLWNAWNRVWTIGTLYGTNGLNQAALAFEETGDPRVFMQLERAPYRGLQGIDNPRYAELFDASVQTMLGYRAGRHTVAQASARILDLLAASGLVPDVWGTLDINDRCPAGVFTLIPLARLLMWGKYRSPEHVRGSYLTGGIRLITKEVGVGYANEIARDLTLMGQFMRDMWINWNNDWKSRQALGTVKSAPRISPAPSEASEASFPRHQPPMPSERSADRPA
jgi:tetracycline 7-halogenase / FADH2 O2-dependent halogenase